MIAWVPHADDKEGNKSKTIGLYVLTRFKDTYKQKRHSFEKKLEHREAPIGFYFDNNDIKMLLFNNTKI